MKSLRAVLSALVPFVLAIAAASDASLPPKEDYVGSAACQQCHAAMHAGWKRTFHSTVVQDARTEPNAVLGDFSEGNLGLEREDIEYTVGAHWAQRYLKRIGGELFAAPKRWSIASHKWESVDTWSWKKKPYGQYCVGCHATRYDPEDRSMAEHTVGCEACHGPGRQHADTHGVGAILNPARLPADEQDMICAACHVRGTDVTGTYQFPVGYTPGERLEDYYIPFKMSDGEGRRDALVREYREWKARAGRGEPPSCDVCGIDRPSKEHAQGELAQDCKSCHKFDDAYTSHMGHPKKAEMSCLDCHRQVDSSAAATDVHVPGYFLVHRDVRYEAVKVQACRGCHSDVGDEELLARLKKWGQHH
jgi:hypothetical protein